MSLPATAVGLSSLGMALSLAVGVGITVTVMAARSRSPPSEVRKQIKRLMETSTGRLGNAHEYPVFSAFSTHAQCVEMAPVRESPLVSVIIPSFRRARSAGRAIKSVLAQQYPPDALEVLLIDDCSPNVRSYERLEQEFAHDPRVRFVRMPRNGGQSAARNRGAALATGKYVAFLDDDDAWLPGKVAAQVACMEAEGATFCCADGVRGSGPYQPSSETDDTKALPLETYNTSGAVLEILRRRFGPQGIPRAITLADILKHNVVITSSVMLTRELFERSRHGFTVGKHCAEDYELWKELLGKQCGGKGLYLSAPLFYYDVGHAGGSWWHKTAQDKTK